MNIKFTCCVCVCVAGLLLAPRPTRALGHLVPAAVPPHSAPTPATRPSTAPSAAAAPGTYTGSSVCLLQDIRCCC